MQKRARDGRAREPSSTRELVESFGVLGESDGEDDATAPGAADGGGGGGVDAIVAVVENRRFEVGVACLRTSDFVVQMSQFCDDQAYSKALSVLAAHEPRQLRTAARAAPPRRRLHAERNLRAPRRLVGPQPGDELIHRGRRAKFASRSPREGRQLSATHAENV